MSQDNITLRGEYTFECLDKNGNLKWRQTIKNTVVTVGKNILLNTLMNGSSYSVTGPYMGLISSSSYSAISSSDTMSSHSGWLEAGSANAPTYSGNRATCSFASASGGSISLSASASFSITGTGTVEGAFLVLGTGASNSIGNTSGTLFSAAVFSGGAQAVSNGDTLNVSYTLSC